MKRKPLIIGMLIAVFSVWFLPDASAQRRHYRPHYGHYQARSHYHRGYHPRPRVYVAPRVVVVPQYGYRRGHYRPHPRYRRHHYYAPPPRHYYGHRHYHGGPGRWR